MIRAFQWDLARQVERLDWLLAQLPRYSKWGYNELYLHLEDAVDYPSLPGVARADAYSWRDLKRLVAAAERVGIGVVPIVNLLGHTQYLIKTPEWRDLNEFRRPDGSPEDKGQICPLHPRTMQVAERLIVDVAPLCTAGKIHVGLDESFHLGRHPLSRAEIAEVGLATHFARYVERLHGLASKHGLRLGMWADMLAFIPDAIPLLPRDIIAYDWYYHAFRRHPRVELFNFAECDLATPLLAHGIEYWGCAMSSGFRHEPLPIFGERLANAQSWWRRCRRVGAGGFLVTSWEQDRLAPELVGVVDAAIATLWLNPDVTDHPTMLAHGFARVFPRHDARQAARAALACDAYPFAGYSRWEVNQRWDLTPTDEGSTPWDREVRLHRRLTRRQHIPVPLAHSLQFRLYLAERDAFVRRSARAVFALRRRLSRGVSTEEAKASLRQLLEAAAAFADAWRHGRTAARRMWRRTRDVSILSPNERMLLEDHARLTSWRSWLRKCLRNPAAAWTRSVMAGAWQLQVVVVNHAPAAQRVVIEQREPDGSWREIASRHTIEFRTQAARPRANVRRSLVVGLDSPNPTLRLSVAGVGDVIITRIELTNGVQTLRPMNWGSRERRMLGNPAPRSGVPKIVQPSAAAIELTWNHGGGQPAA